MLPGCEELEILSVVVEKELCKACISLFYRPPSSSSYTLCVYLESQYSNFILLGDFNVNFCNHSNHPLFSKLESLSYTFAFQQIVSEPMHENSVGLSSTTNPKPKGQPSVSLPAQANLTQQKAEPLRCLALRTRGGRLKSSFVPWELSLPT